MRDIFVPSPSFLTTASKSLLGPLHLDTLPHHTHEVILSFAVYQWLFKYGSPVISRRLSKIYPTLPRKTQINWDTRVVAFVQAVFISAVSLYVILYDEERRSMDWADRLLGYTGSIGMIEGFAAGYFVWDLYVGIVYLDILGASSLVHAVAALTVTMIGFRPFANYYGPNFILYELSSPFLNIHWIFDKLGMTGSLPQLINGIALILTFGGCRLLWGTYSTALIYKDIWTALKSIKVGGGCLTRKLALDSKVAVAGLCRDELLPNWLIILYLGSNTILVLLNFYWYRKMIAALVKRFKPATAAPKGKVVETKKTK